MYFTSFYEILDVYQQPYEERQVTEQLLRDTGVLVLDEIGTAMISVAQHEHYALQLGLLIRHRVSNNAVTIITTNMMPDRLEEVYPRTFSLLAHREWDIEVGPVPPNRIGDDPDARKRGVEPKGTPLV